MKKVMLAAVVSGLLWTYGMAQEKKQFTLEDLNFGGRNYANMIPETRYYEWWGEELVRLDVEACYLVDKKTGKETALIDTAALNAIIGKEQVARSKEQEGVSNMYNLKFPEAGKPLAWINHDGKRVLIDWKQKKVVWKDERRKMKDERSKGQAASEFCRASKANAVVKDDNLYVIDSGGTETCISKDGSRNIVYGQSVHRNEWGIAKGLFWNADGSRLAFYRKDQSRVADYPQVNIGGRIAEYAPDKYPMASEQSEEVTVGVYDLNTRQTIYLQTPKSKDTDPIHDSSILDNKAVYFTNIAWSPDGRHIYIYELNRDQNDCRLVCYDAATGERLEELDRETSDKYVEPSNPIRFLPWDSSKFIFQSQREGYNHLYLYDLKTRTIRQLTSGKWVVLELLGFNEKTQSLIIASNECSPIQRNTFSVDVKTGKRTLLDNGLGYHYASLSPAGQWIRDSWSAPDVPRVIEESPTDVAYQRAVSKGRSIELYRAEDPWQDYDVPQYTSGTIKAADGKTDLYYRMVKPVGFNPAEKYPTVVYVYGGPHAHNVDARWHYGSRSWETYMAQKGYLLFILDNRGSENRGREFEQATFRQLGTVETEDQMQGVSFLKTLPYVDQSRIGVHGWSFGGFMTITLMTRYPEVFKVGVAGGPVIDWKWYEVMYGERYMDTPAQNPEGYKQSSLINKVENLKGKLQIITGANDATVVPQHCLSFLHECNLKGVYPDFYVYPGEPHNVRGHQSVHLHERISNYFDDFLKVRN